MQAKNSFKKDPVKSDPIKKEIITEKKNKEKVKQEKIVTYSKWSIGRREKEFFFENMAMMLSAGINILTVFESLKEETKSKAMIKLINYLESEIDDGTPVWKACEKANLVSTKQVYLIKIGEESGRLPENLKIVIQQQQKDKEFKSKITSAMIYPIFIISIMMIVAIGIGLFVLPRLSSIYVSMRVELPWITKIFIELGDFLGKWGYIAVPVFVSVLLLIIFIFFINKGTKNIGQSFLFHMPIFKKIIMEIEIARCGYILGTLLNAGIPVQYALDSLQSSSNFRGYKKLYNYLRVSIEEGNSFKKSMDSFPNIHKYIPSTITQMIYTGEQTGNLADTLIKIGEIYEAKNEITTRNLAVIIEPVLLIIVWIGVTVLALAIIMPIYSLVGNFDVDKQSHASTNTTTEAPIVEPTLTEKQLQNITESVVPTPIITKLKIKRITGIEITVRSEPITGAIITKVNSGDTYEYNAIQNNWYQIVLTDRNTGWILGDYVELVK